MIELTGLTKSYADHLALRHVDLFVQEGEVFGIIGKSGAGKSTLLRCINLLERPDSGQVLVDGEELTTLSDDHLRRARHKMAMIFQSFNLLNSKTVYDNIGCIGEQFRGSVLTNREFEQVWGFVDKPGGAETFLKFLGVDHVQKERYVGFNTANPELFQRSFHAPDGIDESATTS